VKQWLYENQLHLTAELDASGRLWRALCGLQQEYEADARRSEGGGSVRSAPLAVACAQPLCWSFLGSRSAGYVL